MHVSEFAWTFEPQISENKTITTVVVVVIMMYGQCYVVGGKN